MQIFVDADACPVVRIVEEIAETYAIHQSGKWYTNENIDQMLMERHLNKKARRGSHKNHIKGPKKRIDEDDKRFAQSFEKLVLMAKSEEGGQDGTF